MPVLVPEERESNQAILDAEALKDFVKKLREGPTHLRPAELQMHGTPAVTLHSGLSTTASMHQGPSTSSPQNAAPSADTPQKQSKPHTSGPTPQAPNQPPAPSQAGPTSTPTAAASLKRKSDTSSSPTIANADATKRRKIPKRERNG